MNMQCHPAELASLPVILGEVVVPPEHLAEPEAPPAIFLLCASIGRTAADVAALLFRLPIPECLREVFEFEIRQAVTSEVLKGEDISDEDHQHAEDMAWLAFMRRMDRHEWTGSGGSA